MVLPRRPRRRVAKRAAPKKRTGYKPRAKRSNIKPRRMMGPKRVTGNVSGIATNSVVRFSTKHLNAKLAVARAIKMVGTPNSQIKNTSIIFKSDNGFQNVTSFQHIGTPLLKDIRSTVSTAGALRYVVEEYQSEISFTNSCTAPCEVEIYDVCARRDLVSSSAEYTSDGNTFPLLQAPEAYWTVGAYVQTGRGPLDPFNPRSVVGSSPMDIQLFRENFTITRRVNVSLPQGATHRHMCLQKPNYVVTDALLKNTGLSAEVGLCYWTMFVLKGYPTGSSANEDSAFWNATIGKAQLTMVQATRVKYTWVQDLSNSLFQSNQINSEAYPIINVGSGAIDATVLTT